MSDKPIDVPSEAIVVREQDLRVGILRPADSLDRIAEAFKEYQRVCETILDASDYQAYENKPRKKKSAWRKLATAFNVSTCVVKEEIKEGDRGHVLAASYVIRAYTGPKDNPYRQWEAVGSCSIFEKCCPTAEGQKCRKAAWKGHYCCSNGCDGRKHWTHPDHDVKSTAQTRASNRAVADLIGCGEVSAEELADDSPTTPEAPTGSTPQTERWEDAAERKKPHTDSPKAPEPASGPTNGNVKCATPEQKRKLLEALAPQKELAERYMKAIDWLLPTESIESLDLVYVPVTKKQYDLLSAQLEAVSQGAKPEPPYPPNPRPLAQKPTKAESKPTEPEKPKDDEWWRDVIVPIPHKGEKRDDYLKHPETIGSLYDLRHGTDDLAQEARQRLWGFINHYEAKPWIGKDGKERPSSATDVKFREALDACNDWHQHNHPDEKV